jgi:hypothetical protein
LGIVLVSAACGGGSPGGDPSAEDSSTATGGTTDAEDSGSTSSPVTSAGPDTDAMTDAPGGTEESSSTGAGGTVSELVVVPSTRAVLEADDGGELTVACHVLDGTDPVVGASPIVTVTPSEGVMENGGTYAFEQFGIHGITCEVEVGSETLSATTSVAVLNEAIDPAMARIGHGLGQTMTGLHDVLASNGQDDAVLVEAVATLDAALPPLEQEGFAELQDVLRPVPGDYYPTAGELDAMGITTNADDAALGSALDDLDAALAGLETTLAGFDPDAPTEADAEALADRTAAIEAAVSGLRELEPTAHGLLATRTRVADLVRDRMAPTTRATAVWADARIRSEADVLFAVTDPDVDPPLHFGLLGLTIGMFGDSYLQVKLINDWYGDYIAQLDESFNNFILAGAIEYFIPLGDNPPTIEYLVASASAGFATPGYPTWVDGYNFHEDPEMNLFLVFGDSWQGIIDAIISACGVEEADTVPEKVVTVVECLQEVQAAAESILVEPVSVGAGLYGSPQGLDLGEFPEVCSGGLPTATFLLPINYIEGRGPTYFVNCI